MIRLRTFLIIGVVVFMTSSCFLFRPTHERCPAYGHQEIDVENADLRLQTLSNENS